MKYGQKWRISERTKICGFLIEIQQIWNIHKINESITVAKFEYNLGNKFMKDCENQLTKQKRGTPKRLIIIVVFEEKWTMMLQDKNQELQECLLLHSFLNDVDDNKGRREVTQ